MKRNSSKHICILLLMSASVCTHARGQWTAPTPEELTMTSQPQVPGASAVFLFREEMTEDKLHMWSVYARIKVLNEAGKKYGDIELPFVTTSEGSGYTINDIQGRTIHSDGSIVPFAGKPYEKLIEKSNDEKVAAKVFSLPDVQIGSILEYRYKIRYEDHLFIAPKWYVQSDLFTRKAHYSWKPTSEQLIDSTHGQITSSIGWFHILPQGAAINQTVIPASASNSDGERRTLDLNVHDVMPTPKEENMPPYESLTYRVFFYYTPYPTMPEFWKSEGKYWAKNEEKFIGSDSSISDAVHKLVGPNDTQEQALKKIYTAVMELDNTDFTRTHTEREDKSEGHGLTHSAADVWMRKRGSGDQITALFVAMARAARMKAYVMGVTNRSTAIFVPQWLSLSQIDDDLAIVTVDGKERFFDPGQRDCPFGHLAWQHTFVHGIREMEDGNTSVEQETPGDPYTYSRTQRAADLTLDKDGSVSGTVMLSYTGSPALRLRQQALRSDETEMRESIKVSLEHMLPHGMEVQVASVQKLADYESPLVVNFNVKGTLGSSTGKRILLPGDVFEASATPTFPHEKRELPVYFHYGYTMQDATRVKFPAGFAVESVAPQCNERYLDSVSYTLSSETTPTSVTVRRTFSQADVFFPLKEYPQLRSFYKKIEQDDQSNVVLKTASAPAGN